MAEQRLPGATAALLGPVQRFSLSREKIAEKWFYIVEGGGGHDPQVIENIIQFIQDANMPDVTLINAEVGSGMFSERRPFLVVRHNKLKDYRMFISIRSFGRTLDASWYLTIEPGLFKRTVSKYTQGNASALSQNIDIFSQQDISACVGIIHQCVKRALNTLLHDLEIDPAGLNNTQSKGFLNVW